jgi:hypothetical protein
MTISEKLIRAIKAIPGMSVGDAMWYAIVAGTAYLFFHVLFRQALRHRRISHEHDGLRQISREILLSVQSLAIFGVVGGMIYFAAMCGWTRFYYVRSLVTHRFTLSDIQQAFETFRDHTDGALKVLVEFPALSDRREA